MILVSKRINNQWNINKVHRITPNNVTGKIYMLRCCILLFVISNAILINKFFKSQTKREKKLKKS